MAVRSSAACTPTHRTAHVDDSAETQDQLATLLKLTERYCVVYQTRARGPRLHVAMERAAAAA